MVDDHPLAGPLVQDEELWSLGDHVLHCRGRSSVTVPDPVPESTTLRLWFTLLTTFSTGSCTLADCFGFHKKQQIWSCLLHTGPSAHQVVDDVPAVVDNAVEFTRKGMVPDPGSPKGVAGNAQVDAIVPGLLPEVVRRQRGQSAASEWPAAGRSCINRSGRQLAAEPALHMHHSHLCCLDSCICNRHSAELMKRKARTAVARSLKGDYSSEDSNRSTHL